MPRTRISAWLPVAAWAAAIFAFSSVPSLSTGLGVWDLVLRKLAHLGEFAILGALLARALGRARPAIVLGSLYAASDELHQTFVPGRVGAPADWALDTVGVVIGVALLLRRRRVAATALHPRRPEPRTTPATTRHSDTSFKL